MTAASTRILVIGAGAIGSFYGAVLAKAGAEVSVVCRSDYEAVRENGFELQSPFLGDHVFRPAQVLRLASEYEGDPPDYLILSVKVVEGIDRPALIRNAVGPNTAIVLIQNGVEIEEEIADAYPNNELISALAFIGVSQVAPGKVKHQAYGRLTLGNFPQGISDRAKQLATTWRSGGIECKLTENVLDARWQKCVWNAVFNPISVLGGGLDTAAILASTDGETFVRQGMREVCNVAEAAGHTLPKDIVENNIEGTRKMPPYKTSMALDYEHGRPMEVEAIFGNTVRAARRERVTIPRLEALYALLKMMQMKQLK